MATLTAIFGQDLWSPKTRALLLWDHCPANEELPKLRALSDILRGYWNHDNANVRNIRIYGVNWVANIDTKQLLATALKGKDLEVCPGASFSTDTPEGQALLASPIGRTIAYFLMQHKAELGIKIVIKVTVVKGEDEPGDDLDLTDDDDDDDEDSLKEPVLAHKFFHIENAPPPTEDKEMVDARDAAPPSQVKKREEIVARSGDDKNVLRVHIFSF
jgi:hypothetical protein